MSVYKHYDFGYTILIDYNYRMNQLKRLTYKQKYKRRYAVAVATGATIAEANDAAIAGYFKKK